MNEEEQIKKNNLRWLLIPAAVFLILGLLILNFSLSFERKYSWRAYPGVSLNGWQLGGMNREEMRTILRNKLSWLENQGIKFTYKNQEIFIKPDVANANPGAILKINLEKTIDDALLFGRQETWWRNWINRWDAMKVGQNLKLYPYVNQKELEKLLAENCQKNCSLVSDAKLVAAANPYGGVNLELEKEIPGEKIDYSSAIKALAENLQVGDFSPIEIKSFMSQPEIKKEDSLSALQEAYSLVDKSPFDLVYEQQKWTVDKLSLASWLKLSKKSDLVGIDFDHDKILEFLTQKIASQLDREPSSTRFEMKNGRIDIFESGHEGLKLNATESLIKIENELRNATSSGFAVALIAEKSPIPDNTEDPDNLGIKEIIGTGHSNFAGSPANRRRNIAVGAASVNGLLIKPGEEFSLVKALGKVDGSTGYLPELVIKGNKTTKEYGGGLCQVATTLFRGAIQSGLPITQRRNHSYRVVYYEPAGTDAAVYSPQPDLRFTNDIGKHILIQSRIKGNDIYFDFWGSKDGRVADIGKPVIYNIVKPAPAKTIETSDLKPGQKKCTESAHNGADAYFDYAVTYSNGEKKEKRFKSHYVPWQAICLVGIDPDKKTASSTPSDSSGENNPSSQPSSTLSPASVLAGPGDVPPLATSTPVN